MGIGLIEQLLLAIIIYATNGGMVIAQRCRYEYQLYQQCMLGGGGSIIYPPPDNSPENPQVANCQFAYDNCIRTGRPYYECQSARDVCHAVVYEEITCFDCERQGGYGGYWCCNQCQKESDEAPVYALRYGYQAPVVEAFDCVQVKQFGGACNYRADACYLKD